MAETAKTVPKRLRVEPLVEAIWEIRFSSDKESVADLLPGLIYKAMSAEYPKIERLPAANLPPVIVMQDEALRYVPTIRLEGNPYSIQVGEHVVSLSCRRPYTGWGKFESKIKELAEMLRSTDLISRPERFSLKYIDVISLNEPPSLNPLDVSLKLETYELINNPVKLRTELRENGFIHIVQIVSPAQVVPPDGERFEGVLVDIDTIYQDPNSDFWMGFHSILNQAHSLNKNLFFRLLTKKTITQLEPEY